MKLREINLHNETVLAGQEIYSRIVKRINDFWSVTSDNYLISVGPQSYLTRFGRTKETIMGGLIVARIVDNKVLPVTRDEEILFNRKGVLNKTILSDLSRRDYNYLAQVFDMSEIKKSSSHHISEIIDNLLDEE